MTETPLLKRAHDLAQAFLQSLPSRQVRPAASLQALRTALGGPLPDQGVDPSLVIETLAREADDGLVATAGPRYFGFVIGGSVPAALAADWLCSTWDQNAGLYATSPAASVVEEVAAGWLLELLGLPRDASVGFVTGGQMANFTCLAAARHEVLRRAGWDVESDGLIGAPPVRILVGEEAHVTVLSSLRLLGLGAGTARRVQADGQGRMNPVALERALKESTGPTIVCAQAGNVDTGAFDPFSVIAPLVGERGAWLHVDGAFGLWAAVSPGLGKLVEGVELADSWCTDAHKWLNVPYDSGLAIVAHPSPHRASMTAKAAYLAQSEGAERDPFDWTPEFSRRARGFPVYAALKSLGRRGVAAMIERCCEHARRMARALGDSPSVELLNDVVLNQVLFRVRPAAGRDAGELTRAVIARVQRDGICWLGGTTRQAAPAIRISISNWSTSTDDIDRSAAAILGAIAAENG
jgi:glutamate/tyrosine decarboxylase-like PLP-dependent enzyme